MRKIFINLLSIGLTILSASAFAEKVIISGTPVEVTPSGNSYVVPAGSSYNTTSNYYYVSWGGANRVCYREVQPTLAQVGVMNTTLQIGPDRVTVHCYDYSPDYFTTQ